MEDIINRGGIMMMELYNSTSAGDLSKVDPVKIVSDGMKLTVPAGAILELSPVQSVTLTRGM